MHKELKEQNFIEWGIRMVSTIVFVICSFLLGIGLFVLNFVQSMLKLSEYSQDAISQLQYWYLIDVIFIIVALFWVIAVVLAVISKIKPLLIMKSKKRFTVILAVFFISFIISLTLGSFVSLSNTVDYNRSKNIWGDMVSEKPNEEIEEKYEPLLPFYEEMNSEYQDSAYYCITKKTIPYASYLHIENHGGAKTDDFGYDLEVFVSDNRDLTEVYEISKSEIYHTRIGPEMTEKRGEAVYSISEYEDCHEIRIIQDDMFFSVVFNNLSKLNEEKEYDYEKIAQDLFDYVQSKQSEVLD